ncbi:complex I assembly factor TIMMDC1, mitochondrial [Nerophis ophidion]|uniref:complex I assembly factor TIMMDC1, mitochondrial n=1 Tax=Nerophis ophidion TaxID=159077 RepID=UPI002ADF4A3A|nr:complex I assembly factor TIMMDC1, mitochondrial [Nerophis ophidion]XP_061760638.1 complex I assembly factor TIMMDC1, mitochondrial [Nerophis ophidion]
MNPERPTTGFTLRRQLADSAARGTWSTGLLQGLIQSSGPLCFGPLLPRVHAADMASAQPAQMPSSPSSTCAAPAHSLTPSTMPDNLRKPEFPDTGWDRIKDLFQKNATENCSEEVTNVLKSGLAAALAGFVYGGLPAAHHAKQRYIQMSQAELYTGRVEAVRAAHNAAIRGFVRYGIRWSWRVAAFVTIFNSVSTGLSVYRDKYTLGHFVAAGAVTGGLYRLNLGLRGMVAGAIIGAVLGTPTGALMIGLNSLTGENIRERRRRHRMELYEHQLAEWTTRLHRTDKLIGNLNVGSKTEGTQKDMEKIQEILSLSQNEDVGQDSS